MKSKIEELRNLNNDLDKKINEENQEIFTNMICYIRSGNISNLNQEKVRRDLSEMVISAQSRGENMADVIGGDYKEFCDEVIVSLPPKTIKEKWVERLDIFCMCISILGAINIIFSNDFSQMIKSVISKQSVDYNIGVSTGMVITTFAIIIVAVSLVVRITENALKNETESSRTKRFIKGGMAGAAIMIFTIITWRFGSQILFTINIFLFIIILLGFFIVHKYLNRLYL